MVKKVILLWLCWFLLPAVPPVSASLPAGARSPFHGLTGTLAGAGHAGTDAVADILHRELLPPGASTAITYDADGNVTGDWQWIHVWDANNRLILTLRKPAAIAAGLPPLVIEYLYDSTGRRVQKRVTEGSGPTARVATHKFIYDGWLPLAEAIEENGATTHKFYTWGPDLSGTLDGAAGIRGLLSIRDEATGLTALPCYDGNGNILALIDATTGETLARYGYGPFGEPISEEGDYADLCAFRFSTKYTDAETGLIYYGYRYLNPETGSWMSRDPLGEAGGLNLYGFVGNDPFNKVDPLGLESQWQAMDRIRRQAQLDYIHAIDYGTSADVQVASDAMAVLPNDRRLLGYEPPTLATQLLTGVAGSFGPSATDFALFPAQPLGSGFGHQASLHFWSFYSSTAGLISLANDPNQLLTGEQSIGARLVHEQYLRNFSYGERSGADFNLLVGSFAGPFALQKASQLASGGSGALRSFGSEVSSGFTLRAVSPSNPINARLLHAELQQSALGQLTQPQITVLGSLRNTGPYVGKPGFNVLNVADEAFTSMTAAEFDRLNSLWLNTALRRGDDVWLVTDPVQRTDILIERFGPLGPARSRFLSLELPILEEFGIRVPSALIELPMSVPMSR